MSNQTAHDEQPNPIIDPYQKLNIVLNNDGTITRLLKFPDTPASSDPNLAPLALSKDIPLNQSKSTCLRLFLPRKVLDPPPPSKLPLVVFFHGGGFILLSAASTVFHDFCANLAAELPAVVVSVEYRLAPEHRLPAAYDDAVEALHWIGTAGDDWLKSYADLSNCFLMGDSAGGNMAYQVGLRSAAEVERLRPVRIRGLILQQPFFGGVQRSRSELRLANDSVFPLCVGDLAWELALPVGVDRNHEYCNPTAGGGGSKAVDLIGPLGWKVLVTGWDGDPLFDRQAELAKMLEGKGIRVVAHFGVGEYHAVEMIEPSKAKLLFPVIKNFIYF